jgi:tetratricopeptide (TPR) repeat protein
MLKEKTAVENSSNDSVQTKKQRLIVRVLDAVIDISLFMLFFGLPLFFTGLTFQGISFEKQIYFYFWILLALVVWAIKGVVQGEMKIRKTSLDIIIIVFLLASIVSTIFSVDRWHSFWGYFGDPSRGLANIIAIVIAYYLIASHFEKRKIKWYLGALIVANFISTIWVILVVMKIDFLSQKISQFAPLNLTGSFSGLVVFLSLMLPLLVMAVFKIRQMEKKNILKNFVTTFLLITILLNLFLLLVIYAFISWTGWIAILLGMALFLIYILSEIIKTGNSSWNWLPMAVFVVAIVFLMGGQSINLARITLPAEVSLNYPISWDIAKESLKSNFFLGSGPATYGYDFSLYHPKEFNLSYLYALRFYQGTGAFFETLSTLGAVGTLLLLILIFSYLSLGVYILARDKEKDKIYSLGFFSSSLIFLISLFTVRIDSAVLIIGSLIGIISLAMLLNESGAKEKYLNLSLKASPKFALTFAFIFMVISASVIFLFIFIGKVYSSDIYAGLAGRSQQANIGSVDKMQKAIMLYDKEAKYYSQLAQIYLILANNEALKGDKEKDVVLIQDNLNNSIVAATKAKELSDKDVSVGEVLAQVYENSGFYVKDSFTLAEENYKKALELEPHNPVYFLKLGQIKISQAALKSTASSEKGEDPEKKKLIEEARDLYKKSIDEKNNFDAGYFNLGLAEEALGNIDGAITNLEKAYVLDRSNINYAFNLGRLYQQRGKGDDNKSAEILFKNALSINDKEINTHFYLGLLYEKNGDKNKAIDEYQKVLDLIGDNNQETKDKVQKMIDNVKNGTGNLSQTSSSNVPESSTPAAE